MEVPPPPWRAIGVAAGLALTALGTVAAIAVPRIADDRAAARQRAERAEAERHTAFLQSVDREQRPRRGRGEPDRSARAAGRRIGVRGALLAAAEAGIARDAHARTGQEIDGVECERFPRTLGQQDPVRDLSRPAAAYSCVAVTARFGSEDQAGGRGIIGVQFRLVADFRRGRFAWCRIMPVADRDRLSHPLPDACRLARRE